MALVVVELFASLNDEQRTSPEFWMLYNPQFSRISSEMKNYLFSHLQEFREKIGTEKVDQTVVNQIYTDLSSVLYTQESRYTVDDMIYRILSNYCVLQILPSYLRVRCVVLRIIRKHAKG